MAININGQVLRNVPEQVSKNVEDIEELQDQEQNHETRITALEQGAIALATFQDCTFTGTTSFTGTVDLSACSLNGPASLSGDLDVSGDLTAENGTFSSDVSVTGNLTATGYIKPGAYELDEDITLSNLPTGLLSYYAHARVSNGKLNVVVGFYNLANTAVSAASNQQIGSLSLSADVLSKLYPYVSDILTIETKYLTTLSGDLSDNPIAISITKTATGIKVYLSCSAIAAFSGASRSSRYEFNFIL